MQEIVEGPRGDAMIVGVSRESIQRNVVRDLFRVMHMPSPTPKSTEASVADRTIYFVGANDERAQRKIQGSTLAMVYVDEVTNIPESFYKMLLSRLSIQGAKLFGTTNPDSPFHWFKQGFLDNTNIDIGRWTFRIEDNPSLGQDYINALKSEYSGLYYKRYIDGEWVLAEGVVYDCFDEELHVIDAPPGAAKYYIVAADYGTTNPCVFLMIGVNMDLHPNIWVEKEYYYDSKKHNRQKTDSDYFEDLQQFIKGRNVKSIYIDPSAASFQLECKRGGIRNIRDANNDVLNGIRFVSQTIANGMLKICRSCPNLIREFGSYCWDSKVSMKGEDKPIKEHDHALDALRYAIFSHLGLGNRLITPDELNNIYEKAMGTDSSLPPIFQPNATTFY
jgi:PBSX family phage terminase large subunit